MPQLQSYPELKYAKDIKKHREHLEELIEERTVDLKQEIAERKKIERALRLNEYRLEALLKLNQMDQASIKELTDFALEEAIRLTNSKIGYLAFMSADEKTLSMYSWSKEAMKRCAIADRQIDYAVHETGLWGEAVRQRKPVITNDYQAWNPLKKGYPEGHVPVSRHLNIPVFDGDHIVAVSGVGNKNDEYDDSDANDVVCNFNKCVGVYHRHWEHSDCQ